MYGCLINCRSVTYAQRMARTLNRAGFTASAVRLPAGLLGSGCGHAVKVPDRQLGRALIHLREQGFPDMRVFCEFEEGRYEERPT